MQNFSFFAYILFVYIIPHHMSSEYGTQPPSKSFAQKWKYPVNAYCKLEENFLKLRKKYKKKIPRIYKEIKIYL